MTPEREALLPTIADTAESARERLLDPRNVSKGGWDHLSWLSLVWMLVVEVFEFVLSLRGYGDSPRHEAGDVMVVMAFMRAKAEGLREKEEEVPKFKIGLESIEHIKWTHE